MQKYSLIILSVVGVLKNEQENLLKRVFIGAFYLDIMALLPWIRNTLEGIVAEVALESSSTSSPDNTENDAPRIRNPGNTETIDDDTHESPEKSTGTTNQETHRSSSSSNYTERKRTKFR